MGQHGALGVAGSARGVADERHLVGLALFDLGLEMIRVLATEVPAQLHDLLVRLEPVQPVAPDAARVVVHDQSQGGQLILERQELVHLLLVLGDDYRGLGVVEDEHQLARDDILIDGHRGPAQAHRRDLGPVEPRPVVADHRKLVAAAKAQCAQALGQIADLIMALLPGVRLPYAAILLPHGGVRAELARVPLQQPRKCRRLSHARLALLRGYSRRDTPRSPASWIGPHPACPLRSSSPCRARPRDRICP